MPVGSDSTNCLSRADVLVLHELVVESNVDTATGVTSPGDVEYVTERVREGHFGHVPESVHERAFQLLRLVVVNHPFVDGNKRTALMSVRVFYALNGLAFAYDRQIKEILKDLATDEESVEQETVLSYLREHTGPLEPDSRATIERWLPRIGDADGVPDDVGPEPPERDSNDRDPEQRSAARVTPDGDQPERPAGLSPEEARRYLVRLLGNQDLDEHEEIYEELAYE
jgi:death-on-curing protein